MTQTVGADLQTWADVATIIGTLGIGVAIVGLLVAGRQLSASVRATRMQTLLALDDAFSRYREQRDRIRVAPDWQPDTDSEWVELRRYLSVLDRAALAMDDHLIDPKTGMNAYGTALDHLAANASLRDYVREKSDVWPHLASELDTRPPRPARSPAHPSASDGPARD
jgi:hypothetical protein